MVKGFMDLIAWQKAMDYVVMVYQASRGFPRDERYGLTSQLRRAVVSIPSNISEGHGRQSTREFLNFLSVAYGSLNESQTQILIACRLGYLTDAQKDPLINQSFEVARLINGLINSLQTKLSGAPSP